MRRSRAGTLGESRGRGGGSEGGVRDASSERRGQEPHMRHAHCKVTTPACRSVRVALRVCDGPRSPGHPSTVNDHSPFSLPTPLCSVI
ncbi:hypothetical protein SKAU_G00277410 [Synaphobranchus kaupii]|uniref:Uncharacterized protein n=1 Tax=Synaphobranchus kaupii TaxID=118154 RepID=A0A9Q1F1I5_SYNKA|nr:hypothetical protein SKAU_G00277410 [Synaphobranchus kaupii]